jgi:hypothetical protein
MARAAGRLASRDVLACRARPFFIPKSLAKPVGVRVRRSIFLREAQSLEALERQIYIGLVIINRFDDRSGACAPGARFGQFMNDFRFLTVKDET